jgi:hypothetical protein
MKIAESAGTRLVGWGTLAAVALCAVSLSAADHQGYAKVRYVNGEAVAAKAGGAAQKVERHMILRPGDTIKTDAKSHVDVMLGYNNGSLQVTPGSEVTLEKLTYKLTALETIHDTQLNLKSGSLVGVVKGMAAGSKYEIKTPRGVASIRGTRYQIWANGDLAVVTGRAAMALVVTNGAIKTFTVGTRQILIASIPEVRSMTAAELDSINQLCMDCTTHGGTGPDMDAEARRFFFESQAEPYLPPTVQPEEFVSPFK